MGYRIFITGSGIAEEAQQLLKEENCIFETGDPKDTPDDLARKLKTFDPDGLIVRQGVISGEVQGAAASLKVICKHGVGTDNIDIEAASKRRIPVMYTPEANHESVAEHALALILSLIRAIPVQDRRIREGVFDKKTYDGSEILEKTLGVIGFGRIARRLCELVAPFRMRVLVYHPSRTIETLPAYISKVQNVEELLEQADIISLHCPLTAETKGMINQEALAKMKRNALVINSSRGGVVNEADLISALQQKRIGGAALDVFEVEPPAADNPLFKLENVILTPHVGGVSDSSLVNMGMESVKNVLSVLRGEPLNMASLKNREVIEK